MERPPKLVKPIFTKLQKRLSNTIAAPSLPEAADDQSGSRPARDQPDAVDVQEKIEPERRGRYRVAYPHRERAAHKTQYGARHYGHDGGPYTGHCGHDRRLAVKFRVKISDEGEDDHRRYDHAEYRGERARVAGITITVQKRHISDEQPRQAARDAGQVEQFDVRYFLLLRIFFLYLPILAF